MTSNPMIKSNITENVIYFVNLNDYIDKIFIENDIDYIHQSKITINIPIVNQIKKEQDAEDLYFFSKRAKFYSFFETAKAQLDNLSYIIDYDKYKKTAIKYAKLLLAFDIISSKRSEKYFFDVKNKLIEIANEFSEFIKNNKKDNVIEEWENPPFYGIDTRLFIQSTWDNLNTIQGMHEDCWRKCYLPTEYFAIFQKTK